VTARVCSSLIEGPKAVALPLSPHVPGTPTRRTRRAKPTHVTQVCTLRRKVTDDASPRSAVAETPAVHDVGSEGQYAAQRQLHGLQSRPDTTK
jgi:hypothetical protein